MSEPIQEDGPWSAFADDKGNPVIASDDFTHDVRLRASGNFGDVASKLAYCEEIARRLNEWKDLRAAAERLHESVCNAVEQMNISPGVAGCPYGRSAHLVLRKALIAYADAARGDT